MNVQTKLYNILKSYAFFNQDEYEDYNEFLFETRNRNRYNGVYTERVIEDFIHLKTPYTKILLVNQPKYKNCPELVDNTHVLYYEDIHPDLPPDTKHMAIEVYSKFK